MVERFSHRLALWLIKSGILENDDIELYSYAIQYLLLIINPTIFFTAYCIATHNIFIGLIEVSSFLLIRKYCGGYHCHSSTACLIFSVIMLIGIAWLSSFVKPSLYMFTVLVIADIELILKGPVISVNHYVSDSEKIYYHKCLIGILSVLNIIIIITAACRFYHIASCISVVIIFCFISHLACMTRKNRKLYY